MVKTAEEAASAGELRGGSDGFIFVQIFPADPPVVHLAPFTDATGSVFLGAQIEAGLTAASPRS